MPIFEYKCNDCNTKYEVLHKSTTKPEQVICPKCGSENSKKLLSSFSATASSSSDFSHGCESGGCGVPVGHCPHGMCGLN